MTQPALRPNGTGGSQETRWETLLSILANRERLSVAEAAGELGVSESTIRRDFDLMAERQLAKRTHGGIVAASIAYGLPQRYGSVGAPIQNIGRAAAQLVFERFPRNPIVGINGGTTTTTVAEHLGQASEVEPGSPEEPRLTVVSSALNVSMELVLRPRVRIVAVGGVVRSQSFELTGSMATTMLSGLWLDCLVLGSDALDSLAGVTCVDADEAAVSATMANHAGTIIAVAAANKIGQRSFARICGLKDVDVLVTDKSINADQLQMLRSHKVEVVAV